MNLFKQKGKPADRLPDRTEISKQRKKCPLRLLQVEVKDYVGNGTHQEVRFQDCVEDLCMFWNSGTCIAVRISESLEALGNRCQRS